MSKFLYQMVFGGHSRQTGGFRAVGTYEAQPGLDGARPSGSSLTPRISPLRSLHFLSVHIGTQLRLSILSGHIIHAAKRFYGVTEFCYYAHADELGALLSRTPAKRAFPTRSGQSPAVSARVLLKSGKCPE